MYKHLRNLRYALFYCLLHLLCDVVGLADRKLWCYSYVEVHLQPSTHAAATDCVATHDARHRAGDTRYLVWIDHRRVGEHVCGPAHDRKCPPPLGGRASSAAGLCTIE